MARWGETAQRLLGINDVEMSNLFFRWRESRPNEEIREAKVEELRALAESYEAGERLADPS